MIKNKLPWLRIKINVCEKIFHRDVMELKLERYRMEGAEIGKNVRAFSPISSSEPYLLSVGNNVTISTGVKFCTHDNSAVKIFNDGTDFVGSIRIGDHSFIGMNAIIMGGVKLPEHCIVGAGSIVTKSFLEEGCVIAGNPARIIGNIKEIRDRNRNKVFNFRGMSQMEKKKEILSHSEKYIQK